MNNKYTSKFLIHNSISLLICSILTALLIVNDADSVFSVLIGIAMYAVAVLINGFGVLFSAIIDFKINQAHQHAQVEKSKGKSGDKTILKG